ncbi:LysR family transcriptional regulator [Tabrizicola sp.]|uniref:LysR family transcriptional regulator n=1 Tax=Tabrizicola sp. TaxID=2005166 RepID=UPI003F373B77
MDRLDCDRMFVAVMESGSFARAAGRLGVSSGQASKLVARLESDLGVQLLNRTTRALSPTEMGLAYFNRMRVILDDIEALDVATKASSAEPTGRLRITAPIAFGAARLTPALLAFAKAHPRIELDVQYTDRLANLIDEGFDAAVRIGAPADSSLIARKIGEARIVVVAAPTYLAEVGEPADPPVLKDHACIIDTNFREPTRWRFCGSPGAPLVVEVGGRLKLSSGDATVAAAAAGFGIARVPDFIAEPRLAQGDLVRLLAPFEDEPMAIHVLYPPTRWLAPKVRALIDFLAASFRQDATTHAPSGSPAHP